MRITFQGSGYDKSIESQTPITIREALAKADIPESMVIVSYQDNILPHSTKLEDDLVLLVTSVASGG